VCIFRTVPKLRFPFLGSSLPFFTALWKTRQHKRTPGRFIMRTAADVGIISGHCVFGLRSANSPAFKEPTD
jgi:hypothetical protein